jgi:hypothetical protein
LVIGSVHVSKTKNPVKVPEAIDIDDELFDLPVSDSIILIPMTDDSIKEIIAFS